MWSALSAGASGLFDARSFTVLECEVVAATLATLHWSAFGSYGGACVFVQVLV